MSRASGASGALEKAVTFVLVVLLVLGVAGGAAYLIMSRRKVETGAAFFVEYGGERYETATEGASLAFGCGKNYAFSVQAEDGYTAKVLANEESDFSFTLGGEPMSFWSDKEEKNDYSDVFSLQVRAGGFSITVPEDFSMQKALELKYGEDVVLSDDVASGRCFFVLSVTSGESDIRIPFSFGERVSSVTIDTPQIVF